MKKLVLFDISGIVYRAFYPVIFLKNKKGERVGTIYAFIKVLNKAIQEFEPDYIAACFDSKRDSIKRKELFTKLEEKRNDPDPGEILFQVAKIEKLLELYNIYPIKIPKYEADDVIGAISMKLEKENKDLEIFIVSEDKLLLQLVSKKIKLVLLGNRNERFNIIKSSEDVVEKLGILPSEIPELFGLEGYKHGVIPGIKGIGSKAATYLIKQYKSIENIYENIDDLEGKLKEKLLSNKGVVFESRDMSRIHLDVPIQGLDINMFKRKKTQKKELFNFFNDLGFRSLIKKMNLDENNKLNKKKENQAS